MKGGVKNILLILVILFGISVIVLVYSQIYSGSLPKLVEEINNGTIGVILTAVVTVFLLSQQSSSEEKREQGSKIFEKKLAIYHDFLKFLQTMLKENSFEIDSAKKELLYQLANVKMHTNGERVNKILARISDMVANNSADKKNDKSKDTDYINLADNLFAIVKLFQEELYGSDEKLNKLDKEDLVKLDKDVIQLIFGKDSNIQTVQFNFLQNKEAIAQAIEYGKQVTLSAFKPISDKLVERVKKELSEKFHDSIRFVTGNEPKKYFFYLEIKGKDWRDYASIVMADFDRDGAFFGVPKHLEALSLYQYLDNSVNRDGRKVSNTGWGWWYPFLKFQHWDKDANEVMKLNELDSEVVTYIIKELTYLKDQVDSFEKLH